MHGDLSYITTYQAGVLQATLHRTLQKYSDEILKPYGISKMQWLIIGSVLDYDAEGARLTDLAKTLDTTMPYITNAVNQLVSKGMLIRKENNNDSRSKLISIEPTFKLQCAKIEDTMRESLRRYIYADIDPADFRTYMKVMYQLSRVDKKQF
ncbi:MAG: MarR family transcriptional regulator [Candidatus Saccharimonadales bacterium]